MIELLERFVPTKAELEKRHKFLEFALQMSNKEPMGPGPFPTTEEMIREDRER